MTNKIHIDRDEEILACIIAGAESQNRYALARGAFIRSAFKGEPGDGAACAVGMGLIFHGMECVARKQGWLSAFAEHYDVTFEYACGVSNGFESAWDVRIPQTGDYARGVRVGLAVAAYLDEVTT